MAPLKVNGLAALDAAMQAVGEAIQKDVNQLVSDVVVNVANEVAKRTPIDTAYARSNWVTALAPTVETLMPYKRYNSRWRKNRAGRMSPGGKFTERVNTRGVTEQARSAVIHRKPDQPVYITNNVPYIHALNQGHSQQAGPNFVRTGVKVGFTKAVKAFRFMHLRKMKPRTPRKTK